MLDLRRNLGKRVSLRRSRHPETMKITRRWTDVVRASRPLWHGHPARARERDAPATAGETPAPRFSKQIWFKR
jgi:hypothetical protein